MSPYEQCEEKYYARGYTIPFSSIVATHAKKGFLYATPKVFVMGHPVIQSAPRQLICDHLHTFDNMKCDCWHIDWFAGSFVKIWDIVPYPLPFVSFERMRQGVLELQIVKAETLLRLTSV